MKFALVFVALLVAFATQSDAYCITVYESSGCTGTSTTFCAASAACGASGQVSTSITCASQTTGSTWSGSLYVGTGDCSGTATAISGTGTQCIESPVVHRVDCSTDSACFPADATVLTPEGMKKMMELVVGDEVLASDSYGDLYFDRIFRFGHQEAEKQTGFIQLNTQSGKTLELSGAHYLHVNDCCDLNKMKLAQDVKVGDLVYTVLDRKLVADKVVSIEHVTKKGAFNAHTLSGNIVVGDVAASHFTGESSWKNRNQATYWYRAVDFASWIFGQN